MNRIIQILFCFLILAGSAGAQDLGELSWEEDRGVTFLFADPDQSLLIVESTVKRLSFESNRGIISADEQEAGVWYVRLEPGVQLVTIRAEGYLPLRMDRYAYQPKTVRKIRVSVAAPQQDVLPVMIRVQPAGATIRVDDHPVDVSSSLRLAVGAHSIEIERNGYVTIHEDIVVSEDNILFEYELEKPRLCVVEVVTDPPGAEVWIDGVRLGSVTPVSDFYNSGRYPIEIILDRHVPIQDWVVINPDKNRNRFEYKMTSNTGTIEISSDPEVHMQVSMDGKHQGTTPIKLESVLAGEHTFRLEHEFYEAAPFTLSIPRGETLVRQIPAEPNFATLTIHTSPEATVYLNDTPITQLSEIRLAPQTVKLRAEKLKSDPAEATLILRRGDQEQVDLYPRERAGALAISVDPIDASIELRGDAGERYSATGTHLFKDIPEGMYEITVKAEGHKTTETTIQVEEGEMLRERIVLEEGSDEPEPGTISQGPLPGMEFAYIPAGSFMMGSPSNESGRDSDETQHRVTISRPFEMMTTEVTQAMWRSVMGNNPSKFSGDNNPVELVSWNDIQDFLRKLNARDPGKGYRLPTEAEWEYACRVGKTSRFWSGDSESDLARVGWYKGNSGSKTHPVAQKSANAWGLYDMHGNVWEWCADWYGDYSSGSVTDPKGPSSGVYRVLRGGSWINSYGSCRSANRGRNIPTSRYNNNGFRVVRSSVSP